MARKYLDDETQIGWEDKKRPDDSYLRVDDIGGKRVDVTGFCSPLLNRKNVTDLRDWLTAWLERKER